MKDIRGIIAIVASILVFIIWNSFVSPYFWPVEEAKKRTVVEGQGSTAAGAVSEMAAANNKEETPESAEKKFRYKDIPVTLSILQNEYFKATFSNHGALPINWTLKKYNSYEGKDGTKVDIIPQKNLKIMPLALNFEKSNFNIPDVPKYEVVEVKNSLIRYRWTSKDVTIEKIYSFGENEYDLNLKVQITNNGKEMLTERVMLGWSASGQEEKSGGIMSFLQRPSDIKVPVYFLDGKAQRENSPDKLEEAVIKGGRLYWAGIEDRYFLGAILPRLGSEELSVEIASLGGETPGFLSGVVLPESTLVQKGNKEYNFTVYGGPKDLNLLKKVGMNLDKAIDFGWFSVIAIPILYTLKFLYSIFHNYGIAIIVLTILIKFLLYPISKKSMKSMKGMQKLQPRLKELKEKYGNDKQRLNTEMMQLFKTHKVNPMSGCLPMVLQFPVYIALYRVLWNSIELYQAPFFWFYTDLSQPDPYFISPLLLGVAMFLQQKMTPTATADPAQQKMMMMMPVMFTVFMVFLPVGLVVYILVNTIMTVLQQWMNNNDIRFRDLMKGKFHKKAKA